MHRRQAGQSRSVSVVGRDGLLEERLRLVERSLLEPMKESPAPLIALVDVDPRNGAGGRRGAAGPKPLRGQSGEPVLHREHLVDVAVDFLGGHSLAGDAVGQLRRHTQAVSRALVCAGKDPAAAENPSQLLGFHANVGEGSRDFLAWHERDARKPRQVRDEALGEAAADPVIVLVLREIAEGDDRERVRQRGFELPRPQGAQVREKRRRGGIPALRIARHRSGEHDARLRRHGRRLQRLDLGREVRRDPLGGRPSGKGRMPGDHFVKNGAEGKEVRPLVERLSAELFGRHVAEGPDDGAGLGQGDLGPIFAACLVFVHPGDPEVEQLAEVVAGHHDVFRLDVAVQNARRVGVDEGLEQ